MDKILVVDSHEALQRFFLDKLLKARIEEKIPSSDTGLYQQLNLYLAGVLSTMQPPAGSHGVQYDVAVHRQAEKSKDLRQKLCLYRQSAEYSLRLDAIGGRASRHSRYRAEVLCDQDITERIAFYYSMAASALMHLQGKTAA